MNRAAGLRTVSLRRRVAVMTMLVLAAVLLVVGVLTDVLFGAQARADLRSQLGVRAELAGRLVAQGMTAQEVADRVEAPGIAAVVVSADGRQFRGWSGMGPHRPRPGVDDVTSTVPLADGSQLTLVANGAPLSDARGVLRRTLIVLSVAALAVAGIVTFASTRVALAPLEAMTRLARSITRGDRGRRLTPTRRDTELGQVAAEFDAMLDELEGAESAARASEARMRRFVADAAHELRTPLAGVQSVAEAALAPELDPEERERLSLLLLRESRRAGRLVDDLLDLARLDAGLELRPETVDLLELAEAEADRARMLAPGIEVEVAGRPLVVRADRLRLGQVLANLLDNAARHTPPGGRVVVRVRDDGVLVTDSGPGVPPAERERIFDRLVRLDDARTADRGGAGLGLAIARGIARAHGGDLRCIDPPAGNGPGASFLLTLPAPQLATRSA